jgi:hypothetical protein
MAAREAGTVQQRLLGRGRRLVEHFLHAVDDLDVASAPAGEHRRPGPCR